MARIARVVLAETPHHVTQRGVDRQAVFFSDADRHVYLELVQHSAQHFRMRLVGYCLMSNHVHWIVIPGQADSLAKAFGEAHGRYAHYANALRNRSGHFWQNRFFSCALEANHLWAALRYVERNPLRAGLVAAAHGQCCMARLAGRGRLECHLHGGRLEELPGFIGVDRSRVAAAHQYLHGPAGGFGGVPGASRSDIMPAPGTEEGRASAEGAGLGNWRSRRESSDTVFGCLRNP